MQYTRTIDSDNEFVVPKDEYLEYCRMSTRYEIIRNVVMIFEKDSHGDDALRYELLLDLIDRWENGKTGEFKRRGEE